VLWGGRFTSGPAETLKRFNDSFVFDHELFAEDVKGSIAWARELGRAGVLKAREASRLVAALGQLPPPTAEDLTQHEDVHSYVEARLFEALGPLAGKLHTGRSRNDQVATDLRLYLKACFGEAVEGVLALAATLARLAERHAATAMPGYTHAKRAVPITFGHWCLAYVEMLLRDGGRLRAAAARADECPLGSGALAGTPLPIDRRRLARDLGFARPTANSLDGVSDRDAAAEYLFAAALLLSHLSRLAEDLIFFTSDECGYAELSDAMATGSSRMPQKKNPDVLELVRGHAGRAVGELAGLLALLKGLPLAYDKDLQLDKEPVFRTRQTLAAALPAVTALLEGLTVKADRMLEAASDERLLATEVADALAASGVPFREAHERVGRQIAAGRPLAELGHPEALDVGRAVGKRKALGGTAPANVVREAKRALARIARLQGDGR